tara:strand:+ start:204 stop:824 length:621 start_codon:yes stop_codon:yes gene_type:complete
MTKNYGLVSAVAKGVRGRKKSSIVEPFNSYFLGWSGSGSLVTMNSIETVKTRAMKGGQITLAFYLGELLVRLLPHREPMPAIFVGLDWALTHLTQETQQTEIVLRSFEKMLLEELGYFVDFSFEHLTDQKIDPELFYVLMENHGFVNSDDSSGFLGKDLLNISENNFFDKSSLRSAKKIFRVLLSYQLGDKPLVSRSLLKGPKTDD